VQCPRLGKAAWTSIACPRPGIVPEPQGESPDIVERFGGGKLQKQSYRGEGVGQGASLIRASYRQTPDGGGGDLGGAGPEAIIFRAVLKGSWQGCRQGFIDAAHYLRDEGTGGGVTAASYHPDEGGGGLGGGSGGG
jgi:hypothetical protein